MEMNRNPFIIRGIHELHMEIGEHGYVRADPLWWKKSGVCSPFSRLYLVTAGTGWLRIGEQICRLCPGYAYLVPAGLLFDFGCEDYIEKLYFHIYLTKPDGYDLAQGLSKVADWPMEDGWLERMTALYQSDRWLDAMELKSGIYDILIRLLAQYPEKNEPLPHYSPLVDQGMRYIREHLAARIGAGELAAALYVSESVLTRAFQQEVGKTVRQYGEDMVFAEAQRRLLETDEPLAVISDALGFCDQFYFSRRFRQRHGESPRSYRDRLRTAEGMLRPITGSLKPE